MLPVAHRGISGVWILSIQRAPCTEAAPALVVCSGRTTVSRQIRPPAPSTPPPPRRSPSPSAALIPVWGVGSYIEFLLWTRKLQLLLMDGRKLKGTYWHGMEERKCVCVCSFKKINKITTSKLLGFYSLFIITSAASLVKRRPYGIETFQPTMLKLFKVWWFYSDNAAGTRKI